MNKHKFRTSLELVLFCTENKEKRERKKKTLTRKKEQNITYTKSTNIEADKSK